MNSKKYVAEAIGTFWLVLGGGGGFEAPLPQAVRAARQWLR